jgi:hypothetical protein
VTPPESTERSLPEIRQKEHAGPSTGLTFGIALLSLIIAAALFFQFLSLRSAVREDREDTQRFVSRAEIALGLLGLSVSPGAGTIPPPERDPRAPTPAANAALDQAKLAVALSELRNVQRGLVMRMAEGFGSGFPGTGEVRSYADLQRILSDYGSMKPRSEDAGWVFLSYRRTAEEDFLLLAEGRDSQRTFITVTQDIIKPWSRMGG